MGLVAMDNGESPGNQEPSSASNCSQSTVRGRAGMESNGGTRSTVWGLRTMEPENNLMVFARGSRQVQIRAHPGLHTYLSTQFDVQKS